MRLIVPGGKGGVGKTTTGVALALYHESLGQKVGIIDTDSGHCVRPALRAETQIASNVISRFSGRLSIAVVDPPPFVSILASQSLGWPVAQYLAQDAFRGDGGEVVYNDMANDFFGTKADLEGLLKHTKLVELLHLLEADGCDVCVIDVEATAGLKRSLSGSSAMRRSLLNMRDAGFIEAKLMSAKKPDIAAFLQSPYVQNLDAWIARLDHAAQLFQAGDYYLISIAEEIPALQTYDVSSIIRGIEDFSGTIRGCVVNNVRGESQEEAAIAKLEGHGLPIVRIARDPRLHTDAWRETLIGIGKQIIEETE